MGRENAMKTTRFWLIAALLALPLAAGAQAPKEESALEQEEEVKLSTEEQARIQKQMEQEEQRRIVAERAAEAKERRDKLFEKCVIRPVMTDDDIQACRVAYSY
jgi:hypothetical protein